MTGQNTDGTGPRRVHVIRDGLAAHLPDIDPEETAEWLDSFDAVLDAAGQQRARYLMLRMLQRARERHVGVPSLTSTDYVNTIPTDREPWFPGDEETERAYRRWIRWNAAMTVHRAQRPGISVGGHISSYASSATLYEVGFNHFFRGKDHPGGGDQVYIQGHASPGIYARAFLEGRLTEDRLDGFRQELSHGGPGHGLPSYPHPRLMPDFWEFPTVSMGLGPMNSIMQARFNRYLENRGIKDTSHQHVWAFLGDGEMDEPESRGLIHIAATEGLDNLTFVVNCNLQRLDGPVRGNGKIIQELESFFRGAGWNVIKVIWGREWDALLHADRDGALINLMNQTPDGDYQTYKANDGGYVRDHFFGRDPRTKALVEPMSDAEIWNLKRGGHDYRKVYAAYAAALEHHGQPTVILAKTIKGYGVGPSFAGRNATHQMKKLSLADLKQFRDEQRIPISDSALEENPYLPPYYHPGEDDSAIQYMQERRRTLGGPLPSRRRTAKPLVLPGDKVYDIVRKGSGKQEVATTMAFVRLLRELVKDPEIGGRFVPIIPDEARTFGMDSMFPTQKIYNPNGQQYTSVDASLMLAYRESEQGQLLHEGINEAGSVGSFTAAGTSYATHGEPMIPVYVFYSMFGFQRTGDSIWAAADQMARGFLVGATAGRTTLTGEGLQHNDGHSLLLAATNPAVVSYDPAFSFEVAHIVKDGLRRMVGEDAENVIYYLTVYNEPYVQPAEPEDLDVDGLLRGLYRYAASPRAEGPQVRLLASGVSIPWALQARDMLAEQWGVGAEVWSVTSWGELRRDGVACEQHNLVHPDAEPRVPYISRALAGDAPVIATSDWMRALPDLVRQWVPAPFTSLGTDGFGLSDTRPAVRRHFNVDAESITVAALETLAARGEFDRGAVAEAAAKYRIDDPQAAGPQTSDSGVA
ncbi:pyruvate dehydrogenase (acetyl-transferring), homodimeric type [Pseudonocardia sp. DSM 110487]|uniref:pyruvate dehydrogenase (acetyl-transferring), homodimeric type n=1 Tax=Pseudonocardia sp. DSM 110487 TaxID=2865833 RepID=UPI001C6A077D|nr:pyruvate dehydrogenase (acetyl-transferring), homodimeric type [Pseudonocardia sp. DSM 110487]QYN33008.1 pyruvate dehydrogenase (acetyl-transferring), homodimeric type [Pseudonocardia sp. DSM 110487]